VAHELADSGKYRVGFIDATFMRRLGPGSVRRVALLKDCQWPYSTPAISNGAPRRVRAVTCAIGNLSVIMWCSTA
jgi:hypothetical protein